LGANGENLHPRHPLEVEIFSRVGFPNVASDLSPGTYSMMSYYEITVAKSHVTEAADKADVIVESMLLLIEMHLKPSTAAVTMSHLHKDLGHVNCISLLVPERFWQEDITEFR